MDGRRFAECHLRVCAGLVLALAVAGFLNAVLAQGGSVGVATLRTSKARVVGCLGLTGTVTLTAPAPGGGAEVTLSSDHAIATVPGTVTVAAGAISRTFNLTTLAVAASQPVNLSAATAAGGASAVLVVDPMPPKAIALASDSVVGGAVVSGSVTLPCPAGPLDVVVSLSSSKSAAAIPSPAAVVVPRGVRIGSFEVATARVGVETKVAIRATASGVKKSTPLIVTPQIAFEEVAEQSGILWSGRPGHEGFSVAWTDVDADGWPDLWSLPHAINFRDARLPAMYVNQRDGRFLNRFDEAWLERPGRDTHGSGWADFDNDGDPDVFVSVGAEQGAGAGDKLLLVNDAGVLHDEAAVRGVDYPLGRGRGSLWLDWDFDGLLDLVQGVAPRPDGQAPTALFAQLPGGGFEDRTADGPHLDDEARVVQLADLSGDGRLDLVVCEQCAVTAAHTPPSHLRVFDTGEGGGPEITLALLPASLPEPAETRDVVLADFNNDLHADIFLSRSSIGYAGSAVFQGDERLVTADLVLQGKERGIRLAAGGDVYFDLIGGAEDVLPTSAVYIGSAGRHPASIGFTLRADAVENHGIAPHAAGVDEGLYVGYDPVGHHWEARYSSPEYKVLRLVATAAGSITGLSPIGFTPADISRSARAPVLLMFDPASRRYVDRTAEAGLGAPLLGQTAVAGDFDNDMDLDLYVSCSYRSFHAANVLYSNNGDGTFSAVPFAGGAVGRAVGPYVIESGLAARVAVADYDVDGFLDVFSGPTNAETPTRTFLGEPPQLFRNLGNGNHWIEVDLEGTRSNRDGVGARVVVTAGGARQLREQGGGMHHYAQDARRLHFGLAAHGRVQRLEVFWPSGTRQVMTDLPADRVLRVTEPAVAP